MLVPGKCSSRLMGLCSVIWVNVLFFGSGELNVDRGYQVTKRHTPNISQEPSLSKISICPLQVIWVSARGPAVSAVSL